MMTKLLHQKMTDIGQYGSRLAVRINGAKLDQVVQVLAFEIIVSVK